MRPARGIGVRQGFVIDAPCNLEAEPKRTPIIINNFNRLSCLRRLLESLSTRGYENLYVIDNNSTYEPLLSFYIEQALRVFYLNENVGYLALWQTGIDKNFICDHYVYTDPDIELVPECPDDFIAHFRDVLCRYPDVDKVGFGLEIDDLPPTYGLRADVVKHERQLLKDCVEPGLYRAPIDTTFALYRPGAAGGSWLPSMRTGRPYLARHLPWYADPSHPDDEEVNYRRTARTSTHWTLLDQAEAPESMSVMLWGEPVRVVANLQVAQWNMVWRPDWEPDTYDALDWLIDSGSPYLELGSGIGETALYAARLASTVYAVECDAPKYAVLAQNVALNASEIANIEPLNLCIAPRSESARSVTFADFQSAHPIGDCSLVKVDLGGDEYRVLPTMTKYLREVRPSLHLTMHPRRFFRIKGSNPLAKVAVAATSFFSALYVLWLLRFYGHVYDAGGAKVRVMDLPRVCRGTFALILTDKEEGALRSTP